MIIRTREREKARKLRTQGWSVKQITGELKVAKSSVSVWVRDIKLTSTQKLHLKQREILGGEKGRATSSVRWQEYRKYHLKQKQAPRWPTRIVESFFDSWSDEMAYVLGYFTADGSMYKNKNDSGYISFTSADLELIEHVKTIMKATNAIEIYQPKGGNYKLRYTLQIGSKKIFNRLLALGLTPNKSLTLKFPNVPDKFLRHFVRGYFDGDGCAYSKYLPRRQRKGKLTLHLHASFRCGSKEFLETLRSSLNRIVKLGKASLCFHTGAYSLKYNANDVAKLYNFMYPSTNLPHLKRKKQVLEEGLRAWGRSSIG